MLRASLSEKSGVNRTKPKNIVSKLLYLTFPRVRNDQCRQVKGGFIPDSNPKKGYTL